MFGSSLAPAAGQVCDFNVTRDEVLRIISQRGMMLSVHCRIDRSIRLEVIALTLDGVHCGKVSPYSYGGFRSKLLVIRRYAGSVRPGTFSFYDFLICHMLGLATGRSSRFKRMTDLRPGPESRSQKGQRSMPRLC